MREFVPGGWSPTSISPDCSASIPSFTPAVVRPDGARQMSSGECRSVRAGDIHLYLLIEFQSEIDGWMAVRTQVYQGLLWQQVIDEHETPGGYATTPASVAGGLQRRAALEGRDHDPGADRAVPRLDAVALAATSPVPFVGHGRLPQDELARRSSLVALLFRLERRHSPEGLRELLDEVIGWFRQHEGYERLRGLFAELIREAFARHRVKLVRVR